MGVDLRDLVIKHPIEIADLKGKKIAIDAFNTIYQFISIIRQPDGTPLMDNQGHITSHLSGLFYRTANLLAAGIQPCFAFDGRAPEEKKAMQEEREKIRESAREKFKEAQAAGETEKARLYAQQTARLTTSMIQESKELLNAMGLPWVQALAEGEAQAAAMAIRGHVWAVASQDYDTLLFGSPRLIRNLSISGRKKIPNKKAYVEVKPEIIDLAESLNFLGMDIEALVRIALLIGTDYNPKGVEGIGPKTALKVVREGKFEDYADKIPNWKNLKSIFLKPAITTDYTLSWTEPNIDKIKEILVTRHNFAEERVDSTLGKLAKLKDAKNQKGINDFF